MTNTTSSPTKSYTSNRDISYSYVPNPGSTIGFFFIMVTVYYFIKLFTLSNDLSKPKSLTTDIIYLVIFLSVVIIGNFFLNISVSKSFCNGNVQWYSTFLITFIPWILIFGILNIVLIVFPGWLVPFSNTFGYFVANIAGLNTLFVDEILRPKFNPDNINDSNVNVAKALTQIYRNETLLINEIPIDGDTEEEKIKLFDSFYKTMQKVGLFKDHTRAEDETDENKVTEAKNRLYKFLKMKDVTAEYIWNILCGFLVISLSYNYIVNAGCAYSAKAMKDRYDSQLNDVSKTITTGTSQADIDNLNLVQGNILASS
tara:strand:+ start:472 stop:1413 length:942 start_codon:yes stop_codon:yes gene_type:complete